MLALYAQTLSDPLVFDDVYWFGPQNMRVLGDEIGSESLGELEAYLLFKMVGGQVPYLRLAVILLHVSAAVALFWFLRTLIETVGARRGAARDLDAETAAAIAAVLFAVHPVQVYTVAYPGEQELVLAVGFSLLCLIFWLEGLRRERSWWLLASAAFYGAALQSKANLITVPVLLAAMTWLVVERPLWVAARRLALPLALMAAFAVYTVVKTAHGPPAIAATGFRHTQLAVGAFAGGDAGHAYLRSVASEAGFFFRYLLVWLFPNPEWMSIDIQLPMARGLMAWPGFLGVIAFMLWPLPAIALLLQRGLLGLVGFGLLWPWALYTTEFAVVRGSEAFVLYRSYPWIIGVCLITSLILARLARRAAYILTALFVGILCIVAHERLGSFSTTYTVWDDAVSKNRAYEAVSWAAYRAYMNRGSELLALHRSDEALGDFASALRLNPR